jgi:hypothetical protein
MDLVNTLFSPLNNDTTCIVFYVGMVVAFILGLFVFVGGLGVMILSSKFKKLRSVIAFQWFSSLISLLFAYFVQRTLYSMCAKTL